MYANSTLRWIDLLPQVTFNYNHRETKSLGGLSPFQAKLPKNTAFLKKIFYERKIKYEKQFYDKKPKFHVGDFVKILKQKKTFSRGFTENYTRESFRINTVYKSFPVTYLLDGKPNQKFYEEQLVQVFPNQFSKPTLYIIDEKKIPDTFFRSGKVNKFKTLYLVKDRNSGLSDWKSEAEINFLKNKIYF